MTLLHREKVNKINLWRSDIKIDYGYIDFYNQYSEDVINQIYDLVIDDKIDLTNTDLVYIRYLGYYYYSKKNFDEMKKCFQHGIDNNDSQSIVDISIYYLYVENNKEKSKELLNLAVEKENISGIFRLATAYTHNIFNDPPEFANSESDKLFDRLIELKYCNALDYLGEFYITDNHNPEKAREYFNMMINNGYILGNFGIIKLGCSRDREIELLTEIVTKWETNRCTFKDMNKLISNLVTDNVDSKLLLEHSERLGFKNDDLRLKIQAEEIVLKNKIKYMKHDECPVCLIETDVIPFDCFGHFYCLNCEKKLNKCSLCRIPRNHLI